MRRRGVELRRGRSRNGRTRWYRSVAAVPRKTAAQRKAGAGLVGRVRLRYERHEIDWSQMRFFRHTHTDGAPCSHMEGLLNCAADGRGNRLSRWYALAHAAKC